MKKSYFLVSFLLILISLFFPIKVDAIPTGLEVENYENVGIFIEVSENDFGLTDSMVQTKVELRLRQANLKPQEVNPMEPQMMIYVNLVGGAFNVRALFVRPLVYFAGEESYFSLGTTWENGILGTHAGSAGYILEALDLLLDSFLNVYLKANQ